ncbi:MAG: acetoacetate decarboxylase family protein [Thermoprotei archaeon]|nr:acetoacetate decarboxylase family protein [Thermoprotei archaeon]
MVLKGGVKGYSIPLNAPLYPTGTPIVYYGCRVLVATATVDGGTVDPILPEGVNISEKPLAAFWIGEYPASNVGVYREALIAVQVSTEELPLAYYIPYIYVTNDQALASGRELLGAPKKLARIKLEWRDDLIRGVLIRGSKLLELSLKPVAKGDVEGIKALVPEEIPLMSIRTLPPLRESPGIAQLVQWRAKIIMGGNQRILVGPAEVKLQGTISDPLDTIKVEEVLTGFYIEFDMELHADRVLREWVLKP